MKHDLGIALFEERNKLDREELEVLAARNANAELSQIVERFETVLTAICLRRQSVNNLLIVYGETAKITDGFRIEKFIGVSLKKAGSSEFNQIVGRATRAARPRKETKKLHVREEVRRYLTAHGRAHRAELLGHLMDLGLMGQEVNPLKRLGVMLHMAKDEFGSDGRGNYFLRSSDPTEPERDSSLE